MFSKALSRTSHHRGIPANTLLHEADQVLPWKVSDAPPDYIERMIGAIVGIEIPISKLVGKWKISQNRPEQDKLGIVAGLLAKEDQRSKEMAALVNASVSLDTHG